METGEYTETYTKFMLSAKHEYEVLCERITAGDIPARHSVTILIEIPADWVDKIRFDLIAAMDGGLDGGI
jgi:hypothetical protein